MPSRSYWGATKPPPGVALDLGHPVAAGLLAYWPLGESGWGAQDIVGRYSLTPDGVPSPVPGHAGGAAIAVHGNPDRLSSVGITEQLGGVTQATLSAWVYRASTGNSITVGCSSTSGARWEMLWFTDSNVYCVVENATSSFPFAAVPGVGWHHLLMAFDGTTSGLARLTFYVDGHATTLTASGSDPAASLAAAASLLAFRLGHEIPNGAYSVGTFEDVGVWLRCLTAAEALTLATTPYAMFAPPVWRRYFVPSVTVAPPLTLATTPQRPRTYTPQRTY